MRFFAHFLSASSTIEFSGPTSAVSHKTTVGCVCGVADWNWGTDFKRCDGKEEEETRLADFDWLGGCKKAFLAQKYGIKMD